jgi:hypothetical protein
VSSNGNGDLAQTSIATVALGEGRHAHDRIDGLRERMAGTGVNVVREGDNITLDMPGNVTFAFDSAALNPQFNDVLAKVAPPASSSSDVLRLFERDLGTTIEATIMTCMWTASSIEASTDVRVLGFLKSKHCQLFW